MAVSITGTGAVSCVGRGVDALWTAAQNEQSGLRGGVGYVPDFPSEKKSLSVELSWVAAQEAMQQAGWLGLGPDDGLILATTTGQIPVWDKVLTSYLLQTVSREEFVEAFEHQPLGALLQEVCQRLDFQGRRLLVTSACAASTQALGLAAMWIRQGLVKRCLVGGVEVLCDLTLQGFRCLGLLSEHSSRPFDSQRSGINLSEGAGFLCLESAGSPRARAELRGYGMSADGYHMTAPHPEGKGCFEAIQTALKTANLRADDIDWVHAHGTGSNHNDLAEGIAINTVFGERQPWVSSTKWVHGHALGASGALETILCVEALRHGKILRTSGLENPDAAIHVKHPQEHLSFSVRHILKNTLGFGGTNAALVISRAEEEAR